MQFRHPEILFALLLLIIPIIIHLFQLKRFVKVPFTNVKFLQKIVLQTRKSSQLKKWLILIFRLLTFASLIIAFAQPYFSAFTEDQNIKTNIYIDNSFSMQAKGSQGELMKSATQKIIENPYINSSDISVYTNDSFFEGHLENDLQNHLINLNYAPTKLNFKTVLLKTDTEEHDKTNTLVNNILISDFQNYNNINKNDFTIVNRPISLVKLLPINQNNIYIDSVYTSTNSLEEIMLNVVVKSNMETSQNIPISLFDDQILIGKSTSKFNNSKITTVQFSIPSAKNILGKISITDETLTFDNDFYFSISTPKKINVLSIGISSNYLTKIYTDDEFNFTSSSIQNLNYNLIQFQDLILLDELEEIPQELVSFLESFSSDGGQIVIIPSVNSNRSSYNQFLAKFDLGSINPILENERKITTINFDHPLFKSVFENPVKNFQYPSVKKYFDWNLGNSSNIIQFDNTIPFVSSIEKQLGNFYIFSAPINTNNSSFTQSALIVPLFYNIAKFSSASPELYYNIAAQNSISIGTQLQNDEVLKVSKDGENEFIPLQSRSANSTILNFNEQISTSGHYQIMHQNEVIQTVSFNYNRKESELDYFPIENSFEDLKNISMYTSIDEVLTDLRNEHKINWLFKWFLAFSIVFLLIEMLILKYFKI